jgi:hypothetical protein
MVFAVGGAWGKGTQPFLPLLEPQAAKSREAVATNNARWSVWWGRIAGSRALTCGRLDGLADPPSHPEHF